MLHEFDIKTHVHFSNFNEDKSAVDEWQSTCAREKPQYANVASGDAAAVWNILMQ